MNKKNILPYVIAGLLGIGFSFTLDASQFLPKWEEVSEGISANTSFTYLYGIDGTSVVYAGTLEGLYKSEDSGVSWKKEALSGGKIRVTGIVSHGDEIIVSTEKGLYTKLPHEKWKYFSGKKGFKGVASGENKAICWTEKDLYFLEDGELIRTGPEVSLNCIEDVAFSGKMIYAAYKGGIYYSFDTGDSWHKYFIAGSSEEETQEENTDPEEESAFSFVRKIKPDKKGAVTVATMRDVLIIDPENDLYAKIDTTGLPSVDVQAALKSDEGIFAAAGASVFFKSTQGHLWQPVFVNSSKGKVTSMDIFTDSSGNRWMWLVAGSNIYKGNVYSSFHFLEVPGKIERAFIPSELAPSVREVQRMAIEYAEVSPEKIAGWRQAARWKAILPRVSVDFSESVDDKIEIYKSASTVYTVTGPRERGNDWGVDLSWDLSDLIWNDAQTSIDTRSKLMVQLRDDILEEVTRLYFERKRLIKELENGSGEEEKSRDKALRIEELTGYIDALTGGRFTEALEGR